MIVKVCGMRHPDNIREVEKTGTDWMGFICYERSPRFVSSAPAYLPVRSKRIGVFVNADYQTITTRARELKLDYLQLHGSESPDFCQRLHTEGYKLIKAFSFRKPSELSRTDEYVSYCDYFLFDTPCYGYGGSGQSFDWDILNGYQGNTPFLLSGGIRPESLEALSSFHHPAWAGIDLNSGFETAPAEKDVTALQNFIQQFRLLTNK